MQEHHNQGEHHHLSHARGGKKIHDSGQRRWHVRPHREQTTSSNQIGEPSNGKGGEHGAEQIADTPEHHHHETTDDVGAADVRTNGAEQGDCNPSHTGKTRSDTEGEHVHRLRGDAQAVTHRAVLGHRTDPHPPHAAVEEPSDANDGDDRNHDDHQARYRKGDVHPLHAAPHPLRCGDIHVAGGSSGDTTDL